MLLAMMLLGRTIDARLRNAEGAGGGAGAGDGGAGAGGSQGAGGQGAGGTGQGEGGAGGSGDGGSGGDGRPWYETRQWADPSLQQHLVKSGYHKGTSDEALEKALKGEMSAVARLGRNPASLLDAPAEGQEFTAWLKANSQRFGVPESPDKYDVKLPDNLPKGLPINDKLLADYKAHAHAKGLPPAVVQDAVNFFAGNMGAEFTRLAADAAAAETALTTTLQAEWGGEWKQNQQLAARTFQALAANAKLTQEQSQLVASKLNEGMGDATLLKFFHGMAGLMGEDTLAIPRGGNAPALALAEAQQRKAAIMERHTGAMAQARARGDQRQITALQTELSGLNAIIVQHGGTA